MANEDRDDPGDDQDDEEAGENGPDPQRGDVGRLLLEPGFQRIFGVQDNRRQEHEHLIHQGLSLVGADQGQRLAEPLSVLALDDRIQIVQALIDEFRQARHHALEAAAGPQVGFKQRQLAPCDQLGVFIRRQIDLVAGQDVASLARFRRQQRLPDAEGMAADKALLVDKRRVVLGAQAEPHRRAYQAQQRPRADEQQDQGGCDQISPRDRHSWRLQWLARRPRRWLARRLLMQPGARP